MSIQKETEQREERREKTFVLITKQTGLKAKVYNMFGKKRRSLRLAHVSKTFNWM